MHKSVGNLLNLPCYCDNFTLNLWQFWSSKSKFLKASRIIQICNINFYTWVRPLPPPFPKTYCVCILCVIQVIISNCIDYCNFTIKELKHWKNPSHTLSLGIPGWLCMPSTTPLSSLPTIPNLCYLSINLFCDFHNSWRFKLIGKTSVGGLI